MGGNIGKHIYLIKDFYEEYIRNSHYSAIRKQFLKMVKRPEEILQKNETEFLKF